MSAKDKQPRYDVIVYELETGKVESVVGKNLPESKAERREETVCSRMNYHFEACIVKAGSYEKGDVYTTTTLLLNERTILKRLNKMKRVLITGGSTRAMIDKVRCIGNIFKGRTAIDIGYLFSQNGCDVSIIGTSEMQSRMPEDCKHTFHKYSTYDELYEQMRRELSGFFGEYDVVIHSAAVSDYKVSDVLDADMKSIRAGKVSSSMDKMYLEMVPTEKIIDRIREWGFTGKLVKFKLQVDMENDELLGIARRSREASDADFIVANCLEWASKSAFIIGRDGKETMVQRGSLAHALFEVLK